ncbi:hypothetical protein LENED_007231 [Lentinula edodes]|uniref:Uncharacterized protein n=1 Tax=Lentinula edodes TaxID=5353 RepID=A0A1Q3EDX6_LENED|nr:hypothetical protein LENED_007231 [Lentinula edodes]
MKLFSSSSSGTITTGRCPSRFCRRESQFHFNLPLLLLLLLCILSTAVVPVEAIAKDKNKACPNLWNVFFVHESSFSFVRRTFAG